VDGRAVGMPPRGRPGESLAPLVRLEIFLVALDRILFLTFFCILLLRCRFVVWRSKMFQGDDLGSKSQTQPVWGISRGVFGTRVLFWG
jgi:hypothetical protein